MRIEKITWVASYPKSGSTWLRALIDAYHRNGDVDINRLTFSTSDNLSVWTQAVSPLPFHALDPLEQFLLRPAALFNQLCSMTGQTQFIKTHHVNASVNTSPALIPVEVTCRAVYLVRDPRDIAISLAMYLGKDHAGAINSMNNVGFALTEDKQITHYLSSWSQHVASWVDEQRYPVMVLRYEDLCADPLVAFKSVLEFCKIPIDETALHRAIDACWLPKLQKQEREHGFVENRSEQPFFNKGGSRWQQELDAELAVRISDDHKAIMLRYGYLE